MSTNGRGLRCGKQIWNWLWIGSLLSLGCARNAAKDDCAVAQNHLTKHEFSQAAAALQELLAVNPKHARAIFFRGQLYQQQKQYDLARAAYREAIGLDKEFTLAAREHRPTEPLQVQSLGSDLPVAYSQLGRVLLELNQPDEALQAFGDALQADNHCAEAYCGRGIVFLSKGLQDVAFDDLTEAIRLKPKYAEAFYQRARAALLKNDATQAAEDCRSAIRNDPSLQEAYRTLGSAYIASWPLEIERARAAFREAGRSTAAAAAEISAEAAKLWYDRAVRLRDDGNSAEATLALAQATELDPQYGSLYAVRKPTVADSNTAQAQELSAQGFTHLMQGQTDKAIQAFSASIAIDAKHASAYYGRGLAFLSRKSLATAIADLNAAIRLEKDPAPLAKAYSQRAKAYVMNDNRYQAAADATEAIRLNPELAEAYHHRAMAYVKDGDFDQAIADIEATTMLDTGLKEPLQPLLAEAYRGRARNALRMNHPEKAIVDLTRASDLDPRWKKWNRAQMVKALRAYATQRIDIGETNEALDNLNEALELDNTDAQTFLDRGLLYSKLQKWEEALDDLKNARLHDPRMAAVVRWPLDNAQQEVDEIEMALAEYFEALLAETASEDK